MPRPSDQPADHEPSLSPAEWEVMNVLWDHGPLAARDVYASLPSDSDGAPARGWAYRTVKTLLSRLVAKGALDYEQVGNSYLYRSAVERETMARQEARGLFERLRGGAGSAGQQVVSSVIAQFLGDAELSDEEVQQLKAALERRKKKTGRRRKGDAS